MIGTLAVSVAAFLSGCGDTSGPRPRLHEVFNPGDPPGPDDLVGNEIRPFKIQTFEGSGETVHPDIALVPQWWKGSSWRMVATPYPNGDATYENPSEYVGMSWTQWNVPNGLTNPVVKPKKGYLSDPDQLYNPATDELWMYYRQVTQSNVIWLVKSSDGVKWGLPTQIVEAPNHQIVSPTVVRVNATTWYMWSVNSGAVGCAATKTTVQRRTSSDGVTWSAPTDVALPTPPGLWAWHIDVEWVPAAAQYWAVFNVKDSVGCTTSELEFATSPDGLTWTVAPSPLVTRHSIDDFSDIVYRTSFIYHAKTDYVTFWYSGARYEDGRYIWHTAIQRMPRPALMDYVNGSRGPSLSAIPPSRAMRHPRSAPPPLTNETAP